MDSNQEVGHGYINKCGKFLVKSKRCQTYIVEGLLSLQEIHASINGRYDLGKCGFCTTHTMRLQHIANIDV